MKHPFLKSSSNEVKRRDQQQWLMAAMLSERDVPLLQRTDEKCTWEKKGKDHFSWSALLLANSQGQAAKVLLFTFLTWGWGRKGEGRSEVRASAGPPGTPLPGGRKSMWFLSYLWEGLSAASNADIQWAAKRRKKADTEDENALTRLPQLRSRLFIQPPPWAHARTCLYAGEGTRV